MQTNSWDICHWNNHSFSLNVKTFGANVFEKNSLPHQMIVLG